MRASKNIVLSFIVCIAVAACALPGQQTETINDPANSAGAKSETQSAPSPKTPASGTAIQKPARAPSQNAASPGPGDKKNIANGYPLSPSGKKCPDYAQATIVKKKLSRESADGYLFDAKLRLTGRVEEIAAWGYNLDATRLKAGDKVCIDAGQK